MLRYWLPSSIVVVVVVLAFMGDLATEALRFDRQSIQGGQLWRLLTGNFVHLGWNHVWMNLAGLVLIWLIFAKQLTAHEWMVATIVSSLGVTSGLLIANPSLNWYVGLSGTLHGLFIVGIIHHLRSGLRLEWLLLSALVAKLAWEQWDGPVAGSSELAGGPVIVDAHLYGAVSGLFVALGFWVYDKRKHDKSTQAPDDQNILQ